MHELIFYSLIILVFIRVIGFIVSVDFYYDTKWETYIYSALGWSLWTIAGIFPLLSEVTTNQMQKEFFLLMNHILGPLALTFLIITLSSYYLNISRPRILLFSLILIVFPIIIYFTLGLEFVSIFARIFQFFIIILMCLLPLFKFKNFKARIGKSIRWYYLICISIILYIPLVTLNIINNANFRFFQSESILLIMIVYTSIIIMTILIIAFMIHLEYNVSVEQKKKLKDKYSHNLGNVLQAIESARFLTEKKKSMDNNSVLEVEDIIEKKFREAAEILEEIRKL
ncbi:MAG: hypothetical protein ACFFHV_11985 [Promethearchaeota archaeon]